MSETRLDTLTEQMFHNGERIGNLERLLFSLTVSVILIGLVVYSQQRKG